MTKRPTQQGTCSVCGSQGQVFLAFDLRSWLCPDAKACLRRHHKQINQDKENDK